MARAIDNLLAAPQWKAGRVYTQPQVAAASAFTITENRLYLMPLIVPRAAAIDRMVLRCTTGAADASMQVRWGIYSAGNDGFPAALLVDAGLTTPGVGTGGLTVTLAAVLPAGLVYAAAIGNRNGGVGALPQWNAPTTAGNGGVTGAWLGGTVAAFTTDNNIGLFNDQVIGSWGAYTLPTVAPAMSDAAGSLAPMIGVRAA